MPISIVTNFKVNTYNPIDTRLVATNSAALSEIEFPYEGLTVFTKDQNLNYTYNGTWPLGTWQVSSNGVYGGSGSLVGHTDVNTGSVGSSLNDKSFEYILSASSSDDRAQMVTSFIRNIASGTEYDTVEVRNQVRYVDNTRGVLNGPYISFNKSDTKKGIISLGTPTRLFTTTVERFRIEPDSTSNNGAVVMIPSTYSLPMYFSQKTSGEMFIGYNWDGTSKLTTGTGSSIITFKNSGEISFSNILSSSPNNSPITQMVIGEVNDNVSSTVRFRVDVSGKDMGAASISSISRSFQLRTIPEIIRNVEHNYTKLQSQGYRELSTYQSFGNELTFAGALQDTKTLYITGDGNFFDFVLPSNTVADPGNISGGNLPGWNTIYDIKIVRENSLGGAVVSDAPDGTEVTIRFTYQPTFQERDAPVVPIKPTRIYLWQNDSQTLRKIKSSYADTNGGEYITILQGIDSVDTEDKNEQIAGDIITFRKSGDGFWYVTNLRREKSILSTISNNLSWSAIGSLELTYQSPLRRIQPNINPDTNALSSYVWVDVAGTSYTLDSDHPFRHLYNASSNLPTAVNDAPSLRIAKDLFGNVFIKGSFKINNIPNTSLSKSYNSGISNKLYFANINDAELKPSSTGDNLYTSWGYCEVVVRFTGTAGLPFNQNSAGAVILPGRISVDSAGRVFLQFSMTTWGNTAVTGIYRLEVNVPQFSYSTN